MQGGACHIMQAAVLPLFKKEYIIQDRMALQVHFKAKRDFVLMRLKRMGLEVLIPPTSTFYVWLSLISLPAPINSGLVFFEECLKEKVIVVIGLGFDIAPIHRSNLFASPFHHYVRLSYGPPIEEVTRGLDGIERVLQVRFFPF
jgi:aspartate/methionine/tyrosine aminotransferase